MDPCSSSTAVEAQAAMVHREAERAHWDGINAAAKLKAQGRESATQHGQALFNQCAEQLTLALGVLLEDLLANPHRAGRHLSAWPLLLLTPRGPRSVALVALATVIDTISRTKSCIQLARQIGDALLDEVRAARIEDRRGQALLRLLKRRLGARRMANPKVLESLRVDSSGWDLAQRREIGILLLELIEAHCGLIQLRDVRTRGVTRRLVSATPEALAVIRANPPRPSPMRKLPMLTPPADWEAMVGGGHPGCSGALVRSRAGADLSYLTPEALAPALRVVNALQQQQLAIDPWMVQQQRQAWDESIPGLFPVTREPRPEPPRPAEIVGPEAWAKYRQDCQAVRRELVKGGPARRRIETALRQCEEIAGLPVWFSYCLDFRGRVFTAHRHATHQGPDAEKAAVQFGQGERCSIEGFEWLLRAAAGHWGERSGWAERLRWGRDRLPEMVAAAQDPLDRLDLWRGAKDPWQFLQCCRAVAQQLEDPAAPCRAPVRFDQTCSGLGIAAALVRDRRLALATNICGAERGDIYSEVAEGLTHRLRLDLSNGLAGEQRLAEFWLQFGVTRALVKGPTMTTIYGAEYLGITEQLIAALEERDGGLLVGQWQRGYVTPAAYLSRKLAVLLGAELSSCIAIRTWLSRVCRAVLRRERPLRWAGPSGFPIELAQRYDPRRKVATLTRGKRRWRALGDADAGEGLSARETNRSITANLIHSFDAAFLHQLVSACSEHGVQVLTNHDCFATTPASAGWLHQRLHQQLQTIYATDWLAEVTAQIQRDNWDLAIPLPPAATTLDPAEIGCNPNCFS